MMNEFSITKTMQATAVLLKRSHNREMSRIRLLKLLYIAEREMLSEAGHFIVGDDVVAMDHGPVLSRTYNLIKGEDFRSQKEWDSYFDRVSYSVKLFDDPGNGELAVEEIDKLEDVFYRNEGKGEWEIVQETHQFPEWQKNAPPSGSCRAISFEDRLEALHMLDWKDDLIRDSEAANELQQLLLAAGEP